MAMIIAALENSTTEYKIHAGPCDSNYYSPSVEKIFWNPRLALETTSGGMQSPALGLAHELAHAYMPPDWTDTLRDIWFGSYWNLAEFVVITFVETPTAMWLGEAVRANHYGTWRHVASPTSR